MVVSCTPLGNVVFQQLKILFGSLPRHNSVLFEMRFRLPMTQTGTGVLDPSQVEILRSGFHCTWENPSDGISFHITDFSRLPPGASHLQVGILFYFLNLFPNVNRQPIFVVRGESGRPAMQMSPLVKLAIDASPQIPYSTYGRALVVQIPEEGREHLADFLSFQQKRMTETNCKISVQIIAASSISETRSKLEAIGFSKSSLPRHLGGDVDFQTAFDGWVRTRLSVEEIMSSAPIMRNSLSIPDMASDALVSVSHNEPSLVAMTSKKRKQRKRESLDVVQLPNETATQFAKRKNALYVRRNYYRQKLEHMTAEGEAVRQQELNNCLKAENARLEDLMRQATWWVYLAETALATRQHNTAGSLPGMPFG